MSWFWLKAVAVTLIVGTLSILLVRQLFGEGEYGYLFPMAMASYLALKMSER